MNLLGKVAFAQISALFVQCAAQVFGSPCDGAEFCGIEGSFFHTFCFGTFVRSREAAAELFSFENILYVISEFSVDVAVLVYFCHCFKI